MSPPFERFRSEAARHADSLPADDALAWLLRHGLLSLARHDELPAELREALQLRLRENLARNLLHVERFRRIVDALGELPVCPLKGIHLLDTVYAREPEHRPLTDLDLLARPEDIEPITRRLSGTLGLDTPSSATSVRHPWLARTLSDGSTIVDLHTTLSPVHAEAGSWAALSPRPAEVHGRRVHVLDDATTLVHLVTHLVRHGPFVRLGWVEDVLRLLGTGAGGGAGLVEESVDAARRLGSRRAFLAGLDLLARLWGVPSPPTSGPDRVWLRLHRRLLWQEACARPFLSEDKSTTARRAASGLLLADRPAAAARLLKAWIGER